MSTSLGQLRQKLQNNPYYRLQSAAEVSLAAQLGVSIDVNRASVDDWLRLPGISIRQAQSLVELIGMGVTILSLEDLAAAMSLPIAKVKIWAPVLQFCYYELDSLSESLKFNPNFASAAELATIPVIEPNLGEMIVLERQTRGEYRNLADLKRRLNIDTEIIVQLMHYLQF